MPTSQEYIALLRTAHVRRVLRKNTVINKLCQTFVLHVIWDSACDVDTCTVRKDIDLKRLSASKGLIEDFKS